MTESQSIIWLDDQGVVRVGKPGIALDDIVDAHHRGHSAETILERHPDLSREQVMFALEYHLQDATDASKFKQPLRDQAWQKWNATLADDWGTDTPPNQPIAAPDRQDGAPSATS